MSSPLLASTFTACGLMGWFRPAAALFIQASIPLASGLAQATVLSTPPSFFIKGCLDTSSWLVKITTWPETSCLRKSARLSSS